MGDLLYAETLKRISPEAYNISKKLGQWIAIDARDEANEDVLEGFQDAQRIPPGKDSATFQRKLEAFSNTGGRHRFTPIVMVTQDGKNYEHLEKSVKEANLYNVFFLEGGIDGYGEYLEKLRIIQKHDRGERISNTACAVCQ